MNNKNFKKIKHNTSVWLSSRASHTQVVTKNHLILQDECVFNIFKNKL